MVSPSNFANFKILVKFPEEVSRLADVTRPFDSPVSKLTSCIIITDSSFGVFLASKTWATIYLTFSVIIGMLSLLVYYGYDGYNGDRITTNSGILTKIVFEKIMFVINITTSHG